MALLPSNSQIKIKLKSRIFLVVRFNQIMALDTEMLLVIFLMYYN